MTCLLMYDMTLFRYQYRSLYSLNRCDAFMDDPYQPCFQCNNAAENSRFHRWDEYRYFGKSRNDYFLERQIGETFEATSQSRRIICPESARDGRICRIRVSRAIQFRGRSYLRTRRFVHGEEYLGSDDLEIIRFFQTLFH